MLARSLVARALFDHVGLEGGFGGCLNDQDLVDDSALPAAGGRFSERFLVGVLPTEPLTAFRLIFVMDVER